MFKINQIYNKIKQKKIYNYLTVYLKKQKSICGLSTMMIFFVNIPNLNLFIINKKY